jgi:hypothetical protein
MGRAGAYGGAAVVRRRKMKRPNSCRLGLFEVATLSIWTVQAPHSAMGVAVVAEVQIDLGVGYRY